MTAFERAERYVATCRPAVSGDRGHDRVFAVACSLVQFYRLPLLQAWDLLLAYNKRCVPPWSKSELIHKVADAFKKVGVNFSEEQLALQLTFISPDVDLAEIVRTTSNQTESPDVRGFGLGTKSDLESLAILRGINVAALRWAEHRGVLMFGDWHGQRVYGVTDSTSKAAEIRRLDGLPFPRFGDLCERKSHALRGSNKRWLIGSTEAADIAGIAVAEGVPDFLALHDLALRERCDNLQTYSPCCAPVAMLSATPTIADEALRIVRGKVVRIFPHFDNSGAGYIGASKWQRQLLDAGALWCDLFDFSALSQYGTMVKDLNEFLIWRTSPHFHDEPWLKTVLPSAGSLHSAFCVTDVTEMYAVRSGIVKLPERIIPSRRKRYGEEVQS